MHILYKIFLVVEVAAREYGDYHEKLVNEIQNGEIYRWKPVNAVENNRIDCINAKAVEEFEYELSSKLCKVSNTPWLFEYKILCMRILKQMWRDKVSIFFYLIKKIYLLFVK